jgi:carbamoyltransferase
MNIIGIHYGHDSNVSYLKNGKCIFASSEERLTRVKFDSSWPEKSLNYVLKKYDLTSKQIDYIAIVGSSKLEETSGGSLIKIYQKFGIEASNWIKIVSPIINIFDNLFNFFKIRRKLTLRNIHKKLKQIGIPQSKIIFLDHHFCHAIGAFHASEFDDALIVTCDGKGDDACHKSFIGKKNNKGLREIELKKKTKDIHSIGFFYSMVTEYLGFKALRHEGKITGLAAYGKKDYKNVSSPIELTSDGLSFKNMLVNRYILKSKILTCINFLFLDYKFFFNCLFNNSAIELRLYQKKLLKFLTRNFSNEKKEDIARFAQKELEKKINTLISNTIKKYDCNNICLSGGIFANVRLNQTIFENTGKNIFVMPAMSDAGLSLGAALHVYENKSNLPAEEKFEDIFFGPKYSNDEILTELKKFKLNYVKDENIEKRIANALHENKVVGRFNGSMEWGPRALGNRSILVSAKNSSINQKLNTRLKRTEFMPFAPIVLKNKFSDYFQDINMRLKCIEFMTMTVNVKVEKAHLIPAVIHVDKTARPQAVKRETNNSLYKILVEYEKLSGIPVLINTSFNLHEEPIVCSPIDALNAFKQDSVDFLAIENFWVYKNDL